MIQISFTFLIAAILIFTLITTFVLFSYKTFIARIIREQKQQYLLQEKFQKKMLEMSITIQENERKRISAILHDDVGNKLNILSVWINNPEHWNSERSRQIIANQVPDLIESTRNISHTLFPYNLERLGLLLTLDELFGGINPLLKVEVAILREYLPMPLSTEVQIYRIIQEFLSNVIKHSSANLMCLQIKFSTPHLYIVLADNGIGFDPKSISNGMGLDNIGFRLHSLNALFKWKSISGKGCRLIISIPVK